MKSHTETKEKMGSAPNDDVLALLIRQAGSRPKPPAEAYTEVLDATRRVWRSRVRARRRRRLAYAAAAMVILAAGAIGLMRSANEPPAPATMVVTVDFGFGLIMISPPGENTWRPLAEGESRLTEGARIRIGDESGLALRLPEGESLRLAQQTEAAIISPDRVHLDRGKIYLDSGRGGRSDAEIYTPLGTVRHVGTQFEVTYTVNEMRLRVREGAVQLQRDDEIIRTGSGTQLVVDYDGEVSESEIAPYGPEWEWVQALAPMMAVDEQSLAAFLEWVARETGRTVHFANRELRSRAHTTVLHGQTRRLTPMEALAVMLQTTDFQYTVTGESEILIEDHRH